MSEDNKGKDPKAETGNNGGGLPGMGTQPKKDDANAADTGNTGADNAGADNADAAGANTTAPQQPAPGALPGAGGTTNGVGTGGGRSLGGLGSKYNIGGLLRQAALIAFMAPPVIAGGQWLHDGANFTLGAGAKLVTDTASNYRVGLDGIVGAVRFVTTPFTAAVNTVNGSGPRADVVRFCVPEVYNAVTSQRDTRLADINILQGMVQETLKNPQSDVNRVIQSGGYPVIVGQFRQSASGAPTFYVRNTPEARDQVCGAGFQTHANFRITRH